MTVLILINHNVAASLGQALCVFWVDNKMRNFGPHMSHVAKCYNDS